MTTKAPKPKAYTTQSWIRHVRKTNAQFETLSPARKRVRIAEDVIDAVAHRRLLPQTGVYYTLPYSLAKACAAEREREKFGYERDDAHDARDVLRKPLQLDFGVSCRVCAKGALFTAKLDRLNGVSVADALDPRMDPSYHLLDLFARKQLGLIEDCFESCVSLRFNSALRPWEAFAALYSDSSDRLVAIMKNIVRHRGTFRPERWTQHEKKHWRESSTRRLPRGIS